MMMNRCQVLIVDDRTQAREGLKALLAIQALDLKVTQNSICGFLQRVGDTVVILNRGELVAQGAALHARAIWHILAAVRGPHTSD